eukprot:UN00681
MVQYVKLFNMILSYNYPDTADRFNSSTALIRQESDYQVFKSHLSDWSPLLNKINYKETPEIIISQYNTTSMDDDNTKGIKIPLFAQLEELFYTKSKNHYEKIMKTKINLFIQNIAEEYQTLLYNTADIKEFIQLLQQGIQRSNYTFKFKNYQDQHFSTFFKKLTSLQNKDNLAKRPALQCEKIILLLNARTDDGEVVWNNGQLVFVDSLHLISKLFYKSKQMKRKNKNTNNKWLMMMIMMKQIIKLLQM